MPPFMPKPLEAGFFSVVSADAAGADAVSVDAAGADAAGALVAALPAPGFLPPFIPNPTLGLGLASVAAPAAAAAGAAAATFSFSGSGSGSGAGLEPGPRKRPPRLTSGRPRLTESSSICETSTTSILPSFSVPDVRAVTPSVSITRQNGQPVAIFCGASSLLPEAPLAGPPFAEARVSRASSTRSMLIRLPICSSIHMRAPPAPQHMDRSPWRGISRSVEPDASISSRGAS